MITKLLHVQPSELKFPCSQVQLNKFSTCWLQITNRTDHNVAFKVKTTHPKKYCVRPNVGIVSPGSTRVIRVSMQSHKESITAGVPKDKFLIQSMIAPVGLNAEDLTSEMFRKERGNGLEELMLRVAFVTANPPSPIPEASEEECSPEASEQEKAEHMHRLSELFEAASAREQDLQHRCSEVSTSAGGGFADRFSEGSVNTLDSEKQSSQSQVRDWDLVSKLAEEKSLATVENQELQHELGLARKQIDTKSHNSRVSILVLLFACFVGFVLGYTFK